MSNVIDGGLRERCARENTPVPSRYAQLFSTAIREALASLPPEEHDLLGLSILQGLTIDQLAARLGAHRTAAARRLARARDHVFEAARNHVRAELGVNSDFRSTARLLRSMADLSLRRLLEPAGASPFSRSNGGTRASAAGRPRGISRVVG